MDLNSVGSGLTVAGIPQAIVDEVLESYAEAKRRYYLGDHRPQEVEGGRFSEGIFRLLQHVCGLAVTPIGRTLPSVDILLVSFENATGKPDSVRLHIPRTLKLIYDIRNKRDVAHLGDGIDPNLQDATLVIANMDWVLAELVRLYHHISPGEAQSIIETVVRREVPAVEEINGQPVILSKLKPRDQVLLMLYRRGAGGISLIDLALQLRTTRRDRLKARIDKLDEQKLALVHPTSGLIHITALGMREVEQRKLAAPAI